MKSEAEAGWGAADPPSGDVSVNGGEAEGCPPTIADGTWTASPVDCWWPRIPLPHRYRTIGMALALSDGACALAGLFFAHLALVGWSPPSAALLGLMAIVPVAWIASFRAFGLYDVRHLSALEEFRRLIGATCVATSLVTLLRAWSNIPPYRKWLVLTWLLALAFELGVRRFWRWQLLRLRRGGHLVARTVILGTNGEAARLARSLRQDDLGFKVIGHVATEGGASSPNGLPVVGHLGGLNRVIRTLGVECVFVASSAVSGEDMVSVAQVLRRTNVEIRMSANLADILISRLSVQRFNDVLSLSVKPVRMSTAQVAVKRLFDVCLATLGLLVTLPFMAVVAMAVRLTSPGPILYRQERVTRNGRVFIMYKFRTMRGGEDSEGRVVDLDVPYFKLADDPRLTRVGRLLRRCSLDELPQLWNVFRGDLSVVGPRPLPVAQVVANPQLMGNRHEVRAGITGWWQINGRSSVEGDQALRMDLFYIENWSLSLDLFILLRTAGVVLSRRGAC